MRSSRWEYVEVAALIDRGALAINDGYRVRNSELGPEGIPFIRGGDIGDGTISTSVRDHIRPEIAKRVTSKLTQPHDVAFISKGTVGRSGILRPEQPQAVFSPQVCYWRSLDVNYLSPWFIFYFLRSSEFQANLDAVKTEGAMVADYVSMADQRHFRLPVPPIQEQRYIVSVLKSLDDKIELNRRMNATLEGMAQALFKSWFVDFDPVIDNALAAGNPIPDELAARAEVRRQALANGTAKHFPAAFQETESMGWIPEGWEASAVSEAISVNPSTKLKKGDLAPFADMKALPTSGYAIDGVIEKAYSGGAKFQNGDVLLARITPCLENGKTGIVDFLTDSDPVGFGSTEFIVLRGEGDLSTPFVACLARDSSFRKHCVQSMIGSSGRQRVHNSCFDSYYLALPKDRDVVCQFNALAVPAFAKATSQSNESKTLENLRDTLLPKLISGELRVSETNELVEEVTG